MNTQRPPAVRGWFFALLRGGCVAGGILSTAVTWAVLEMGLDTIFNPWDTGDSRFLPLPGTLTYTVHTTLQRGRLVIPTLVTLLSGVFLVRALLRAGWHPRIVLRFVLTQGLLLMGLVGSVSVIPSGSPPSYERAAPGIILFTIVLGLTLMLQDRIARTARDDRGYTRL